MAKVPDHFPGFDVIDFDLMTVTYLDVSTGRIDPMIDELGEETDDPDKCKAFVCEWGHAFLSVDMSQLERIVIH